MATIRTRKRKSGGVSYYVEVCVKGRRLGATFDSKSQAHAWAEETERTLRFGGTLPGELPDGDRSLPEVIDLYSRHLERSRLKTSTKLMYDQSAKRILAAFPEQTLRGLDRRRMAHYCEQRLTKVGSSSVRQDFCFLRGLYKFAKLELDADFPCPVSDLQAPSPPKHREPILSQEEMERLLESCRASESARLFSYVLFMLHTAMRPSEAATLTWLQILWKDRMVLLSTTKTGKSRRVPLTQMALSTLQQLRDNGDAGEYVFLPPGHCPPRIASMYFRTAFATACRRAGIQGITLYSLRHISASYLIMCGVDIRTVADIMGHSDIGMTMRYTHIIDKHKLDAIDRIGHIGIKD